MTTAAGIYSKWQCEEYLKFVDFTDINRPTLDHMSCKSLGNEEAFRNCAYCGPWFNDSDAMAIGICTLMHFGDLVILFSKRQRKGVFIHECVYVPKNPTDKAPIRIVTSKVSPWWVLSAPPVHYIAIPYNEQGFNKFGIVQSNGLSFVHNGESVTLNFQQFMYSTSTGQRALMKTVVNLEYDLKQPMYKILVPKIQNSFFVPQ